MSDFNTAGQLWPPAGQPLPPPGAYWIASQAEGACEGGVKVLVEIVDAGVL